MKVIDFKPLTLFSEDSDVSSASWNSINWAPMHQSDAKGVDLIVDDSGQKPFGLGWIEFPAFGEVNLHTHEGSHILICFRGSGEVRIQDTGDIENLLAARLTIGKCYNIASLIPHSVHAGQEGLLLLVIGNDYRTAASHERLQMIQS